MSILRVFYSILVFAFLTIFTQVGGLIYLIWLALRRYTDRFSENDAIKKLYRSLSFSALYLICTFVAVPFLAPLFGRVQLPLTETRGLRPHNFMFCLLNRNYVRPALRDAILDVTAKLQEEYPGSVVNYLDTGFPFVNVFVLFPHLSHNDGKKADLSFQYTDAAGAETGECPSWLGYGICEEPGPGEYDYPTECAEKKGGKTYSMLKKYYPQGNKANFIFDGKRTAFMVRAFSRHPSIGLVLIEPHLKKRLHLNGRIGRAGCHAVRHDDHMHVQLW